METLRLTKVLMVLIVLAFSAFMLVNESFQYMPLQITLVIALCGVLAYEEWTFKQNITNALTILTGVLLMVAFLIFS